MENNPNTPTRQLTLVSAAETWKRNGWGNWRNAIVTPPPQPHPWPHDNLDHHIHQHHQWRHWTTPEGEQP